ncbi:MAG: hypothetical protein CMA97_00085 [Euryarchaeota archaeon]|mgnify:FL=1|nr:hypothetical protein [Euryarchaeota archaeon]
MENSHKAGSFRFVEGVTMTKQSISIFLVFLLIIPLLSVVSADESEGPALEAKNLTAVFDLDNETTTLSWENIDTNDFMILDDLKLTNYSLYRSDEPLNSSNYMNAQLIQDNIQACLALDTLSECKERTHTVTHAVPPSTNGSFYYGVVSTLQNGTIISNFTEGNAALAQPIHEFGSSIASPYALQAFYDVSNATTTLTWIDISMVDSSFSTIHTTSIWSHAVAATPSNWDSLAKTEVAVNLSSAITQFDIVHQQPVSHTIFYTVLHSFDGESDTRLLSGNTLSEGIVEDNTGSSITGTLVASFDSSTSITSLNWNGSIIEDANHTLHVWRSPSAIVDLSSNSVTEIAQLSATAIQYNYTVESSYSGQTYYLVTLSDQLGNQQSNLASAPNSVVVENTLIPEENIIDDISASFEDGTTQITWTDIAGHPEAQYQIWRSSVGRINSTILSSNTADLLAVVDSGQEQYNNIIAEGTSENAWYAVTVIASFGTQDVTYAQTTIIMSYNSMMLPIVEDTAAPNAPESLDADYSADGTTQLRWAGSADEDGTTWMLYRNMNTDFTDESDWVFVGEMPNVGVSLHTLDVQTVAMQGEVVNPVYAIGGIDAYGNSIEFSQWKLSNSVKEDRQNPQAQLKLFDSSQSLETSRWFTGGESSSFSNLEPDTYSIQFTLSNDVVSVTYLESTQSQSQVLDLSETTPSINIAISDAIENITFTFTVTDASGNSITFDALFCTTCLIQPQVIIEQVEVTDDVDDKKGDDSDSMESLLIGVCALLGVLVLLLLVRGSPKKAPRGLPTAEEDQWLANYVNE